MTTLEFKSFEALAVHLYRTADEVVFAEERVLNKLGPELRDACKKTFGEYQTGAGEVPDWAELAESTKDDRLRHGYPPDGPLLRSGADRESIQDKVDAYEGELHVFSNRDTMLWHEFGTRSEPPRSVFALTAVREEKRIVHEVASNMAAAVASQRRPLMPD